MPYQTLILPDPNTMNVDLDSVQHSDILILNLTSTPYSFCVSGRTLVQIPDPSRSPFLTLPESSFPFARMGGFADSNSSSFYIYHQLNASAFAEDHWDDTQKFWTSNPVTISMT